MLSAVGGPVIGGVACAVPPLPVVHGQRHHVVPTGRVNCVVAPLAKASGPVHVKVIGSPSGSSDAEPSIAATAVLAASASSV